MSNNWELFHSKTLGLDYAYNKIEKQIIVKDTDIKHEKESDIKKTKDGTEYVPVIYNSEEIAALEGKQITLNIHSLKKIFKGRIVNINNTQEVQNG